MFLAQGLLNQGMDVLVVFDNQYTRHSGLLLWGLTKPSLGLEMDFQLVGLLGLEIQV